MLLLFFFFCRRGLPNISWEIMCAAVNSPPANLSSTHKSRRTFLCCSPCCFGLSKDSSKTSVSKPANNYTTTTSSDNNAKVPVVNQNNNPFNGKRMYQKIVEKQDVHISWNGETIFNGKSTFFVKSTFFLENLIKSWYLSRKFFWLWSQWFFSMYFHTIVHWELCDNLDVSYIYATMRWFHGTFWKKKIGENWFQNLTK